MKSAEFIEQHGPTLKEKHLDWLTALKDESMADVWDNTNDPLILVEILRCLLNSNYDSALNEYVRDALITFEGFCDTDITSSLVSRAIEVVQDYVDGKIDKPTLSAECAGLHKEMLGVMNQPERTEGEKKAIFSTSFCINWLVSKDETSAVYAAYHATEHLMTIFNQEDSVWSERLRELVGNPFS